MHTLSISTFGRKQFVGALLLSSLAVLGSCKREAVEEKISYDRVPFENLSGWQDDNQAEALQAFLRSCTAFSKLPSDQSFASFPEAGTGKEWKVACKKAKAIDNPSNTALARRFFEENFIPYSVTVNGNPKGLFTGYHEIELKGSLTQEGPYQTALYKLPKGTVKINLRDFVDYPRDTALVGINDKGWLKPMPDRAKIEAGELGKKAKPLAYVDDPVGAFFLHIQGSGRVYLPDGSVLRVGYAGTNGHDYTAIGKILIEEHGVDKSTMSAQVIKTWLRDHPSEAVTIMNRNPSYVFFHKIKGDDGPIGAQGVPLTTERSLAVDKRHIPYGAPLWLETTLPAKEGESAPPSYKRLLIAQDTGGAIKGGVRGDVFFGAGDGPEWYAGQMKQEGRYTILLPKPTTDSDVADAAPKRRYKKSEKNS
ncbi:MAG: murein transglycosylase [Rickettsiales bacterium]|nr:murein transglycosylase [Rickettsiales bacterium]